VSECGKLPVELPPTDELMVAARTAAEWRAAADIELGYPLNRDPDIQLYWTLDQRAKDACRPSAPRRRARVSARSTSYRTGTSPAPTRRA